MPPTNWSTYECRMSGSMCRVLANSCRAISSNDVRGNDPRDDLHALICSVREENGLRERRVGVAADVSAYDGAVARSDIPRDAETRRYRTGCQNIACGSRGPVKAIDAQARRQGDARRKLQLILDVHRQPCRVAPTDRGISEVDERWFASQVPVISTAGIS